MSEELPVVLSREERKVLARYRWSRRRREGKLGNPAVAWKLALQELPSWMTQSAPAANVRLAQVANVDAVVFFGVRTIEGGMERLSPCESRVLLLVRAVKLGMLRVVGQLCPETISTVLGDYRPRIVRAAIRRLEDLELLVVDRERGRISKVLLHPDLMQVYPRRPHKELSTGNSQADLNGLLRQKNAALISKRTRLNDNPVNPFFAPPPAAAAPPAAPSAPPPLNPPHEKKETPRSGSAGELTLNGNPATLADPGSSLNSSKHDNGINGNGTTKMENNSRDLKARLLNWFSHAGDFFVRRSS